MKSLTPQQMEDWMAGAAHDGLRRFIEAPTPANRSALLGNIDGYQQFWILNRSPATLPVNKPEAETRG